MKYKVSYRLKTEKDSVSGAYIFDAKNESGARKQFNEMKKKFWWMHEYKILFITEYETK